MTSYAYEIEIKSRRNKNQIVRDKLVLTSRGALLGERKYCSSKPRKKPTCQGQSDHLGPVSLT